MWIDMKDRYEGGRTALRGSVEYKYIAGDIEI